MPRVYETMRRGVIPWTTADAHDPPRFVIRLWLDTEDDIAADDALSTALELGKQADTQRAVALAIERKISHLNAVEVLDAAGQGSVIYTDWP